MATKLVLPRPPERYDAQAESQRNLILEQAFAQLGLNTPAVTVSWGGITGALSAQTDLQAALDGKQATSPRLTSIAGLSYTGNALRVVRVNAAETGFELATPATGGGVPDFIIQSYGVK